MNNMQIMANKKEKVCLLCNRKGKLISSMIKKPYGRCYFHPYCLAKYRLYSGHGGHDGGKRAGFQTISHNLIRNNFRNFKKCSNVGKI